MMRRYEVRTVFDDSDFGNLPMMTKRFFSRLSANHFWYFKEQERKAAGVDFWHRIVVDLKTGDDITPKL